jgi:hypothetical protein
LNPERLQQVYRRLLGEVVGSREIDARELSHVLE